MSSEVQSVMFNKEVGWTTEKARKWMSKHNYKPIKRVHETEKFYRYRIQDTKGFKRFRVQQLGLMDTKNNMIENTGIQFVLGWR